MSPTPRAVVLRNRALHPGAGCRARLRRTTARGVGTWVRRRSGRPATSTSSTTAGWWTSSGHTSATTSSSTFRSQNRTNAAHVRDQLGGGSVWPVVQPLRPVHPADDQLRPDDQLLPPEHARRRSCVQGGLPLPHGAGAFRDALGREHNSGLPQRRSGRGVAVPGLRHRLRSEDLALYLRTVYAQPLHPELGHPVRPSGR